MLPKASKSCPKCNKSPNLVTLVGRQAGTVGSSSNSDKKLKISSNVTTERSKPQRLKSAAIKLLELNDSHFQSLSR